MTPEELADMLYKALLSANPAMVQAVARQAVDRYAGHGGGAARWAARTTSTGRCGTSTSTR